MKNLLFFIILASLTACQDLPAQDTDLEHKTLTSEALQTLLNKAENDYKSKNYTASLPIFERLSNEGDKRAQRYLAIMYLNGEGVVKDEKRAFDEFKKSANQGDMKSPRYLGLMYLNGQGVAKNAEKAFIEFKIAAERGDITGQYWLGYCYENGIGTDKDLPQAISWYQKSAERGDHVSEPAMEALKRLGVN